mmetsp:Transcript_21682/g.86154  ORF Transcript_21682/g.86154 Transcript_21682/m.86154 type:complete len:295 (+) Transcript_21682:570-1454(+)
MEYNGEGALESAGKRSWVLLPGAVAVTLRSLLGVCCRGGRGNRRVDLADRVVLAVVGGVVAAEELAPVLDEALGGPCLPVGARRGREEVREGAHGGLAGVQDGRPVAEEVGDGAQHRRDVVGRGIFFATALAPDEVDVGKAGVLDGVRREVGVVRDAVLEPHRRLEEVREVPLPRLPTPPLVVCGGRARVDMLDRPLEHVRAAVGDVVEDLPRDGPLPRLARVRRFVRDRAAQLAQRRVPRAPRRRDVGLERRRLGAAIDLRDEAERHEVVLLAVALVGVRELAAEEDRREAER